MYNNTNIIIKLTKRKKKEEATYITQKKVTLARSLINCIKKWCCDDVDVMWWRFQKIKMLKNEKIRGKLKNKTTRGGECISACDDLVNIRSPSWPVSFSPLRVFPRAFSWRYPVYRLLSRMNNIFLINMIMIIWFAILCN